MTVCMIIDIVGTAMMKNKKLNCWIKLSEKFAMFPEQAESKYKNIITGYGVDHTSKGKNLFLDVVPGQENSNA